MSKSTYPTSFDYFLTNFSTNCTNYKSKFIIVEDIEIKYCWLGVNFNI